VTLRQGQLQTSRSSGSGPREKEQALHLTIYAKRDFPLDAYLIVNTTLASQGSLALLLTA
jgi:hypothetical protein